MNVFLHTASIAKALKLAVLCFALPLCSGPAIAGSISTPDLNAIYGQASFGSNPIRVEWLSPGATIVSPTLASIDSEGEFSSLIGFATSGFPVVTAFFVDSVNWCGGGGSFLGCGLLGGSKFVVQSAFAAGPQGATTLAHELAHNLGLGHVSTAGNLMTESVGSTALTNTQANTILNSFLVQTASNGSLFVQVRPVAVVVSAVPEPQTYLLFTLGLWVVFSARRRLMN